MVLQLELSLVSCMQLKTSLEMTGRTLTAPKPRADTCIPFLPRCRMGTLGEGIIRLFVLVARGRGDLVECGNSRASKLYLPYWDRLFQITSQ